MDSVNLGDEELLIAVANTGHSEHDEFADAASVRAWWDDLVGSDTGSGRRIALANVAMLRNLRDLVRNLALHNNGVETTAVAGDLDHLDLRFSLRGGISLRTTGGPTDLARDVCAAGVTALLRASARPGWPRFKACRGTDCRWVFVDVSRNSSRRWCDMAGCGNRAKSVSFRRRQHASGSPA